MTRHTNNKKINIIISSAKKLFLRSVVATTASVIMSSTTGCGVEDVASVIASTESVVSEKTEGIKEINEAIAEKIDKIETINIITIFSEAKEKYASKPTSAYDEEGKKLMDFDINTLFKIIGMSEDGKWLETEEGLFIKSDDVSDDAVSYVKECSPETLYTQYNKVKVHVEPDKASETVFELPANQAVLKTGEAVFGLTKTDASGDHGWSEVKFKSDGEVITGYVYTDYLGSETTSTVKEAVEVKKYTDEEKEEIKALASEYGIDSSLITTDEEYYELKRAAEKAESAQFREELDNFTQELLAKAEAKAAEREAANAYVPNIHSNTTWSSTHHGEVPKPYDHAATKAEAAAWKEKCRQEEIAEYGAEIIDSRVEFGMYVIDGYTYNIKRTITTADGVEHVDYICGN